MLSSLASPSTTTVLWSTSTSTFVTPGTFETSPSMADLQCPHRVRSWCASCTPEKGPGAPGIVPVVQAELEHEASHILRGTPRHVPHR